MSSDAIDPLNDSSEEGEPVAVCTRPQPGDPDVCAAWPGFGTHRCLLPKGHTGKHRCDYCGRTWGDNG
jgi:hypothetical protein